MTQTARSTLAQLAGFGCLLLAVLLTVRWLPVVAWIGAAQERIGAMGTWGALLYPLLFALCNILLLPGGVIAMGGGLFFGLWWGTLLVLTGNLLAAAVAFGVSRILLREWMLRKFSQNPRFRALDAALRREGWKMIVLSQIHPLFPTSLLNYLYGITALRFWPCMGWITLAQLPGLFLYAYLGTLAQWGVQLAEGRAQPARGSWLWLGGLVLTVGVTAALGVLARKWMKEMGEKKSVEG